MAQPLNYSLDFSQKLPPQEQARIQEGMTRSYDHADLFWKNILNHCIWEAARKLALFTVDDVLGELDKVNVERKAKGESEISTHNLAALGMAMRLAAKEGVMARTDQTRRSKLPGKHGNLQFVWKSNFYSGGSK